MAAISSSHSSDPWQEIKLEEMTRIGITDSLEKLAEKTTQMILRNDRLLDHLRGEGGDDAVRNAGSVNVDVKTIEDVGKFWRVRRNVEVDTTRIVVEVADGR